MPRIQDEYLNCVAYLYRSRHEAEEAINIGGSAFLVTYLLEELGVQMGVVYAVTNKHVIQHQAKCLRVNTTDGTTDVFALENWHLSATDDLAVCLVPYLNPLQYLVRSISLSNFLTTDIVHAWGIGPGDEVVLIGRFVNQEGKQRNTPTVRFGHIAQMPSEPIECDGHLQESFLCEIKSIGGFSGSPVFVAPTILPRNKEGLEPDESSYLLGIDWCHLQSFDNAINEHGETLGHIRVPVNTGMMGVIPAWKLRELLDSKQVKEQRDMIAEREKNRREEPSVVLDAVLAAATRPSNDANPTHREDFTRLVGAAARKPEPKG
jgi:hypothetical protein